MSFRALLATALLVVFPVVCAFAADDPRNGGKIAAPGTAVGEAAPERIQEKTSQPSAVDTVAPPPVNASDDGIDTAGTTSGTKDNLQTARKPDESPLRDIRILPSF